MVNGGRPAVWGDGQGESGVMNTRLGNILYNSGMAGAGLSLLYSIDAIWVHASGRSLLQISGRHVSREEMLFAIAISITAALLFWGAGSLARFFLNKSAKQQAGAGDSRS